MVIFKQVFNYDKTKFYWKKTADQDIYFDRRKLG